MNSSQPTYRYPGAQPFKTSQQNIFFGRKEDIQKLYELISLEDLVVLYGKSGLGKSSLLNAGILPKVEVESDFEPLYIRFGAYIEGSETYSSPLLTSISHLQTPDSKEETSYLDKLLPNENSLWYHAKKRQSHYESSNVKIPPLKGARGMSAHNVEPKNKFLLIFDQFEELFTYPKADIQAFGQQLKELLNRQIPQRFRAALEVQFEAEELQLSEKELEQLHDAFEVKVVMAIRSDRMSLLNGLKDSLPNILRHCYELQALSEEQAEDAILNPAHKKDSKFISPPFDYDNEALDNILAFLTKDYQQKVESFQLQIVCEAIEKKIIAQQLSVVTAEVIGNLAHILKNHYDHNIAALGRAEEQLAARRLIEEGLILEEEERRLSLYEGQIYRKYGISPELLQKLVNSHLLRAEPSMQGGYTYELSHDTLVVPVLIAKKRRKEQEEKQRLEAEKIARERELAEQKRQLELERQRKVELANALQEAERQKQIAEQKQTEAESNELQAKQRTRIAFGLLVAALLALGFAGWQYFEAKEKNKAIALIQLDEAQAAILELDFEKAHNKIRAVSELKVRDMKKEVASYFRELAFWYTETHRYDKAKIILEDALNQQYNREAWKELQKNIDNNKRYCLNKCLKIMDKKQYQILQERYYPKMIKVKGGQFSMGCNSRADRNCQGDESLHSVFVNDFAIGESEVTVFQYSLYLFAEKKDYKLDDFLVNSWSKESLGLTPIVNVTWFDAMKYNNWLNLQKSIKTKSWNNFDWAFCSINNYRLPTEAEWEFVAKEGVNDYRYQYSGSNNLSKIAWHRGNTDRTKTVKQKKPNSLGIFDLNGNVWEWCFDYYKAYPTDSIVVDYYVSGGAERVLRGGSWANSPIYCRVANRASDNDAGKDNSYGFRVAQSTREFQPSFELKKEEVR